MPNHTALTNLLATELEARDFGFEWPNEQMIVDYIISECHEVMDALKKQESRQRVQEEIGDLLQAAISLCRFAGFDVEDTLSNANNKFTNRLRLLKEASSKHGLNTLSGQSIDFMMELWNEVKLAEPHK